MRIIFENDQPANESEVSGFQQAFSVMRDSVEVPRDRRRHNRRQMYRRNARQPQPGDQRNSLRRSHRDRRGMHFSFQTRASRENVMAYVEDFDRNWFVTGLDRILVKSSRLAENKWALHWQMVVDDLTLTWRSMAAKLGQSGALTMEGLGGDMDAFEGRLWVTALPTGSELNFDLLANLGLGSFERLVGNIFKQKCHRILKGMVSKWHGELELIK